MDFIDRLKYIKIEDEEGNLSENVPIGADAENVDFDENQNIKQKINSVESSMRKKDTKIEMSDLSQEIKEAMTGGAVPVVGNNSVQNTNIMTNANDRRTTDFIERKSSNLFNGNMQSGYYNANGNYVQSESYIHTDFIPIKQNQYISWLLRDSQSSPKQYYNPYAILRANIRFVAWFDANFQPIVGNGYDNESYTKNESVQAVDANVAYAIISVSSVNIIPSNYERVMILVTENALEPTDQIPWNAYKDNLKETFYPNNVDINSINNLFDMKLQGILVNQSTNFWNPNVNKQGFWRPNGFSNNASYIYTPKIPIKTGQYISLRQKNTADEFTTLQNIRLIMFYDINGNNVQFYDNESNNKEVIQATSPDIAYCVPSIHVNYNTFNFMLTVDDTDTTEQQILFVPFSTNIGVNMQNENPLQNKSIANFGDSIAQGANGKSYGQQIANNNDMLYYTYAVGGATLAIPADSSSRSSILTQVQNFIPLDINPDFILINGGTNDILYNALGEITSFYVESDSNVWNTSTSAGALEKIFSTLKTNKPSSKIIYVIPHKMNTRNQNLQEQWFTLIKQICQKWSVPIASIYDDGNLNTNIEAMRIYTDAGTHPTAEGYTKFYVPIILSKMKEID